MSRRTIAHARRSVLTVPGSSDRFLAKAQDLDADMVLLDLEDAVTPAEKPAARHRVARAIARLDWGDKIVGVRVNSWRSPFTLRDIIDVVTDAGPRLDIIMLAKAANATEVAALDLIVTQLEAETGLDPGHLGIEALIESAEGLVNVAAICAASPRLEAIAIGAGDLAASLAMPLGTVGDTVLAYPGDHLHHAYLSLVVAARAHGLQVIDGPYLGLGDTDRLRELALRTRALGVDGKWAIHPDQLATINEVYTPTPAEIERASEMIQALDDAAASFAQGAIRHGGEMLDEVNRKMAQSILDRARRTDRGDE